MQNTDESLAITASCDIWQMAGWLNWISFWFWRGVKILTLQCHHQLSTSTAGESSIQKSLALNVRMIQNDISKSGGFLSDTIHSLPLGNTQRRLTEGNYHILLGWAERFSHNPHILFWVSWKTYSVIGVRQTRWEFWVDDHILRLECNIWSWSAFLTNWSIIRWNWLLPPFTLDSLRTGLFFSFHENKRQKAWNTAPLQGPRLCESQWLTLYTYLLLQYQMERGWDGSALVNIKYHGSYYSATAILQQQQFGSKTFSISHYI